MRPIRFVHTSDVHLDTSFSGAGLPSRLGDRKREAIRGTFRRLLDDALAREADIVLIAGDLFELDRVTPDTVEFLKQQFERLGDIKVFIAPGNHDPCIAASPYREDSWPPNVHIFREEAFRSVDLPDLGVRITGYGFNRTHLQERLFSKLPALPTEGWNFVLAHASDVSRVPAGKTAHGPFAIAEIAGKNVHYCALGHYHQPQMLPNPIDETQVWYCGIPEGRGWDEEGARGYLQGEIANGEIHTQLVPCNQIPLQTIAIECDGFSSREQIIEAILEKGDPGFDPKTILRVRLRGYLDPKLDLSLGEIEERLAGEVLHIHWDDQAAPAFDFQLMAREKSLRGHFVRAMNERIASAPDDERVLLLMARLYGTEALSGGEVRIR